VETVLHHLFLVFPLLTLVAVVAEQGRTLEILLLEQNPVEQVAVETEPPVDHMLPQLTEPQTQEVVAVAVVLGFQVRIFRVAQAAQAS
jgi:hypothetical protein